MFRGVSFRAAAGELVVLKGRNGAGKTSLLRMIAGLIEPAAGALRLEGRTGDLAIGQQCHLIAHQDALKPALTVRENLAFWADFLGGGDLAQGLEAFALGDLGELPAGLLSAGQKRRLALSRLSLLFRPIWLLDEPTVGLDASSQQRLERLMGAHLAAAGLIIAATHVELARPADRVVDFDAWERAA